MASSNLMAAHSQWANRPADERFWTLGDMMQATELARLNASTARKPLSELDIVTARPYEGNDDVEVALRNRTAGKNVRISHYAFAQLCGIAGAPAAYLRTLPPEVAAPALSTGLARRALHDDSVKDLLFQRNGGITLRAALSSRYDRVWDADVCEMLVRMGDYGWRVPAGLEPWGGQYKGPTRIATAEDILPGQINIRPGMTIAPSGLYASDHDMFAFLVAPDRVVEDGTGGALMRGIFVRNSEVGDASLSVTFFLMQAVCGNHIVWNATGVHEIRLAHIGRDTLGRASRRFAMQLRDYANAADSEAGVIRAARTKVLGAKKEDCLEAIFKYAKGHSLPLTRERIASALVVAEEHESWYGNPRTLWAAVAGLTHDSQNSRYADDRNAVDRSATSRSTSRKPISLSLSRRARRRG